MKNHINRVIVAVVIFYIGYVSSRESCTASSIFPKFSEILNELNIEDVIVEAKYINNNRFTVTHSWNVNNGNLDHGDPVVINIDDTTESLRICFESLVQSEKYLLLLQKEQSTKFTPKLGPLLIKKRSTRDRVWNKICSLPAVDCAMSLSRKLLPAVIQMFPSMNNLLRCGVKSRSRISEIRWFKDGKDIEQHGGDFYAENGLIVRNVNLKAGKSDLIIYNAHSMHSGVYSCTAKNTDGETASIATRLTVGSLFDAFIDCPSSANGYCQNNARCMAVRGLPNEIVCECKPGYKGSRCHDTSLPELGEVFTNEQELSKQVVELRTILIAISCCCASLLLLVIVLVILRVKNNKVSKNKEKNGSAEKIRHETNNITQTHESVPILAQNSSPGRRQRLSGYHEKNSFKV